MERKQTSPWRRLARRIGKRRMLKAMNLWPPFLGAGVRVAEVAEDLSSFEVELRLWPWNRNWVGTHFGGSLYAMCDPFFMLILLERLGDDYVVWDKAGSIRYLVPGRGKVRARFAIPPERLAEIRAAADRDGRHDARFEAVVEDARGAPVARVEKVVQVRRADAVPFTARTAPAPAAAGPTDPDRPPGAAAGR